MRLEPLDADRHGDDLFAVATLPDAAERHRYLFDDPPESRAAFRAWLDKAQRSEDPLFYAVIDKASGQGGGAADVHAHRAGARLLSRSATSCGGRPIARKPAATEAHYLFMRHAFEDLGYRRWEWKCNDLNAPSKRAAERFGHHGRGRVRPAHGGEGPQSRHGVVCDPR